MTLHQIGGLSVRRIQLGFIVLALLAISLPAFAGDKHDDCEDYGTQGYRHDEPDCEEPPETTTTTPETSTTVPETTTTAIPMVEVCVIAEGLLTTIPFDEYDESLHVRVWDDFDRRDCEPPPVHRPTTIPTLPWIYFPPDPLEPVLPWTTTSQPTALTELPFTGIDPGLGVLAGLSALALGGLLVRRGDDR
jgi:hypothetical protein